MHSTRAVKIGIIGAGFGASFFFRKHPQCRLKAVSAYLPEERNAQQATYQCVKAYGSLTALLKDAEPLRVDSGHGGSHTFITHEFIDAIIHNRQPEVDVEEAIAYTLPGIVVYESALKDGERLIIPAFESL